MPSATKLALATLSLAGLVGCRAAQDEADEFRHAVPQPETVTMRVPGAAAEGQALTLAAEAKAGRGEIAGAYLVTRRVSVVVNGAGALVLGLVKRVTDHPPTKLEADTAVWGPWPGGPLDPLVYKVTVNRVGSSYQYRFEGRAKTVATASFVAFLTGTHTPARDGSGQPIEGFGKGDFTLDWDARATLPAPGDEIGKVHYDYARETAVAPVQIAARFRGIKDAERPGKLVDVDYIYNQTPGALGSMEFSHALPATMTSAGARWAVKSRWLASGAGRSDIVATGGDLGTATATASECWSPAFASLFLAASWAPGAGYGNEATDCAFPTADHSKL